MRWHFRLNRSSDRLQPFSEVPVTGINDRSWLTFGHAVIENNLPPAPSFFAWAGIEIQKGVQTGDAAEADARFAYESILKSLSVGTPSEPRPILKTKNAPRGRILTMAEREGFEPSLGY